MPLLPTAPRTNEPDPLDARIFLYSKPKVGKTTLAHAWAPRTTLFLDTEGGTRLLTGEHYVLPVPDWLTFETAVRELATGRHRFRTVVIDTSDRLYEACDRQVGLENGVSAAALVEYGKGTGDVEGRFKTVVQSLLALRIGVWFTSHATVVETEKGKKQVQPTVHKKVRDYLVGSSDFVLYAERAGVTRQLRTLPTELVEAGSRVPLPDPLPLDARALYGAIAAGQPATKAADVPEQAAPPAEPTTTPEPATAGGTTPTTDGQEA